MKDDDDDNPIISVIQIIIVIWLITTMNTAANDINKIKHDVEILKLSHCYADADMKGDINAQKH